MRCIATACVQDIWCLIHYANIAACVQVTSEHASSKFLESYRRTLSELVPLPPVATDDAIPQPAQPPNPLVSPAAPAPEVSTPDLVASATAPRATTKSIVSPPAAPNVAPMGQASALPEDATADHSGTGSIGSSGTGSVPKPMHDANGTEPQQEGTHSAPGGKKGVAGETVAMSITGGVFAILAVGGLVIAIRRLSQRPTETGAVRFHCC